MARRTSISDLSDWESAVDVDDIVHDKRSHKRATAAKARRRNRRYANRLLSVQLRHDREWQAED